MKRLIATLLLLAVSGSYALAQVQPTIGMYEDPDYTYCYGDHEMLVAHNVYMAAWLPNDIAGITACEFAVSNLPDPGDCILTAAWTTTLVIGSLDYDLSLAWTDPQAGPWVLLGTLTFIWVVEPPMDVVMEVVNGQGCDCLVVVDDEFLTIDADGGMYTVNCSVPNDCVCFFTTPTEDTSWGSLKSLY